MFWKRTLNDTYGTLIVSTIIMLKSKAVNNLKLLYYSLARAIPRNLFYSMYILSSKLIYFIVNIKLRLKHFDSFRNTFIEPQHKYDDSYFRIDLELCQ